MLAPSTSSFTLSKVASSHMERTIERGPWSSYAFIGNAYAPEPLRK